MTRSRPRTIARLLGPVAACLLLAPAALGAPFNQSPDPTWQTNGRVRAIVYSGGTVYLGGEFTALEPAGGGSPVPRNHLAALDASTGTLLPWNPGADGNVWALAVDPTHSVVYAGGQFATLAGQARPFAGAIDAASGGALGWNPQPDGPVYSIAVSSAGNVYFGGAFTLVSGHTRNRLAETAPDGTLAAAWNPSVKQVTGSTCPPRCPPLVDSVAISPDGNTVYFGGHFGLVDGVSRNNAAAVDASSGTLLPWDPDVLGPTFGTNPKQANRVWHVELASDRAYLCGDFWSLDNFQRHPNIAAVDLTAGHLIKTFKATTDGNTPSCVLAGDGMLYLGGHYIRVGPNSAWVINPGQKAELTGPGSVGRTHISAVDALTGAIDGWAPTANSTLGVHALATTGAQLFVGGDFTIIGHVDQQGFAGFSLDTTAPDTGIDTAPPADTAKRSATFTFHATENQSSFRCSLDGHPYVVCDTPVSYSGLGSGDHSFLVAAVDDAGNPDLTPSAYAWTVDGTVPSPPGSLNATVASPSRVELSWTASPSSGVTGYLVYRNGSLVGQTAATTFADTTVNGTASWTYTARAIDGSGDISSDSNADSVTTLPALPMLFRDGFESGDLSHWTNVDGLGVDDSLVYSGAFGARASTTGNPSSALLELGTPTTELFYDVRVKFVSMGTQATLLRISTATGVPVVRVFATISGALGYQNMRKQTAVTSTLASLGPGWHNLQVRVLVNGSAGEVEIWLDGIRVDDLARVETLGITPLGEIELGDDTSGHVFDAALDQVAVSRSYRAG
jgi:hypothetical protein